MSTRLDQIKQFYVAFSKVDRNDFIEDFIAPSFTFSAPPDPLLNREEFFNTCWPNGSNLGENRFTRLIEHNDEVIVTHEYLKPDGIRGCNTDIFTFSGEQITRMEVYFGWDITN